jgi:hypothetical protein
VRLLLDEMLDKEIAVQLRRRGHDVESVQEQPELWGKDDLDLLRHAASATQVIVTDNVPDFLRLNESFLAAGESHAGILLAASSSFPRSNRRVGLWVTTLDRFLASAADMSMVNNCIWLQRPD